jgi:glucose/mannose transport system substrate-binding protein
MHWLTSGRDAAALAIVRDELVSRGGVWHESPMPGAGTAGEEAAVNRIVGGRAPEVWQFSVGAKLADLAAHQLVAPVPLGRAAANLAIPGIIDRASRYGGELIAIPVDIRGENWLFYNVGVLRAAGVAVPRTWQEFLSVAERLKARGIIPIALGGQPWQERLLFDAVLLGIGGREFYKRVFERLDPTAISSETMLNVFQVFAALRGYVDESSPGRRWGQATNMLTRGVAAFQFMGDWAKGEIWAAGLTVGRDIGCVLAPAKDAAYIMMVDAFAFSRVSDPDAQAGQRLFAQVVLDRRIQTELALRLGALPARSDLSEAGFDPCSSLAMAVIRDPEAQLMEPGLSLPSGLAGAIDDTISRFWNDRTLHAAEGRRLLSETIRVNQ